ncbi:MAG TPA: ArsA family ATPase, partial [Actinomycetota bacterium]|nr:ArsA family ATPase [Actinomycetota bacterium]
FVVVTEAARASMEEASFFVSRLRGSGMRAAAVVVNRWHPEGTEIPDGAEAAVVRMAEGSLEERALAGMLADRLRRESARLAEADAMSRFIQRNPGIPVIAVPELEDDVHDVPGLRRMGGHLFSS